MVCISVMIPEETDKQILELRKTDKFIRCSYSEIVRQILKAGLAQEEFKHKQK